MTVDNKIEPLVEDIVVEIRGTVKREFKMVVLERLAKGDYLRVIFTIPFIA
jgi:hypothetical protein